MKACAKCGKAAEFGDEVCPSCGSSLKDQNGPRDETPPTPPVKPVKASMRPIVAIAGAFVVGGIVALILISMDSAGSRRVDAADGHVAVAGITPAPPRRAQADVDVPQWV